MNEKAQASIEFMFLISIAMIYIATVVMPAVEISKVAAEDVTQLAQTRMAAEKLVNAIDSVAAASGDAKQTVTIFVPARGAIECLNCSDPKNPSPTTCSGVIATSSGNVVMFEFLLTKVNQNVVLEHRLCQEAVSGGKACKKYFVTSSVFYCSDASRIGNPAMDSATTKEVAIQKTAGRIDVIIPSTT